LLLALLAAASRSGSWCAVVGVPALGVLAAAESGVVLERLALVPNPGPEWPTVVAALIDGVDVVVAAVPGPVSASIASRLVARARQRGSVLMPFGGWAGADVTLQVMHGGWEGLGAGRGRVRRREVTITARGRGAAARPREITMWMPGVTTSPPPNPAPGLPSPAVPGPSLPAGPGHTTSAGSGHMTSAGSGHTTSAGSGAGASAGPGAGGVEAWKEAGFASADPSRSDGAALPATGLRKAADLHTADTHPGGPAERGGLTLRAADPAARVRGTGCGHRLELRGVGA